MLFSLDTLSFQRANTWQDTHKHTQTNTQMMYFVYKDSKEHYVKLFLKDLNSECDLLALCNFC